MKQQRNYTTLSAFANGLDKVRWQNDYQLTACCPAHNDRNPSFSAKDDNGKILVKCFSGCTQDEVIISLSNMGLWHKPGQPNNRRRHGLKKAIRHHQTILAIGVCQANQGQELSDFDRHQMARSIEFLKERGYG